MKAALCLVLLASCAELPPRAAEPEPGPEAYVTRAERNLARGDRPGALADLEAALKLSPNFLEALLLRGRLGHPADLETARKLGAGLAVGYYNEGVRALSRPDLDEADRHFGFALDLDPAHLQALVGRSRVLMERRRFEEAALCLDRALALDPGNADLVYHRGTMRLATGRGAEALVDFERAVSLDPRRASYIAARGLARHRVRADLEGALRDYDEAIRLEADCFPAWYNRGLLAQERGDLAAAERDLRHAVGLRAQPEGNLALARVLIDRGAAKLAIPLCEQSIALYADEEIRKLFRVELDRARRAEKK